MINCSFAENSIDKEELKNEDLKKKIFVGGIPKIEKEATENDLLAVFSQFGAVKSLQTQYIKTAKDPGPGSEFLVDCLVSRGFAYVIFEEEESVLKAVSFQ